jgi:anti-sigma regulatory factor (Ser/Thr protein kinase)
MQNVGAARRFVRAALQDVVPNDVVADLALATSELVTNAFEHGPSAVVVTTRIDAEQASVSVRSSATDGLSRDVASWKTAPPERLSGRGLGIVSSVADDVEVQRIDDEVEVTVRRRFVRDPSR